MDVSDTTFYLASLSVVTGAALQIFANARQMRMLARGVSKVPLCGTLTPGVVYHSPKDYAVSMMMSRKVSTTNELMRLPFPSGTARAKAPIATIDSRVYKASAELTGPSELTVNANTAPNVIFIPKQSYFESMVHFAVSPTTKLEQSIKDMVPEAPLSQLSFGPATSDIYMVAMSRNCIVVGEDIIETINEANRLKYKWLHWVSGVLMSPAVCLCVALY